MKILKLSLALIATAAFSQAAPINYAVNLSFDSNGVTPVTLTGSITTDGTIGQIRTSNILSFSLTETYNSSSSSFSSAQALTPFTLDFYATVLPTGAGNGVLASSTQLSLLTNSIFLGGGNPDAGNIGFYIGNSSGSGFSGRAQNLLATVNIGAVGPPLLIGTAPAGVGNVPEPSSMCLLGFGLGAAWISQRKRHANR